MQELDISPEGPRGTRAADASFPSGLLFGLVVGAGLVLVLSPEFRSQVNRVAQELGIDTNRRSAVAARQREEVLSRVAPPPDPLSSSSA